MKKIAQFLRHRIGIVSISVTFLFLSSAARNCDKKEQHDFKPEINCDDDTEKTLRIPTFPSPICIFDNFYFQQFPDFCTNETSFIIIYSCCLEQLNTGNVFNIYLIACSYFTYLLQVLIYWEKLLAKHWTDFVKPFYRPLTKDQNLVKFHFCL